MALNIDDRIIGSDTREYTVTAVTAPDEGGKLLFTCSDPDGNFVHATVNHNDVVDAILIRAQSKEYADRFALGVKRCENCSESRSVALEWDPDDYICKLCRHLLDSGYA